MKPSYSFYAPWIGQSTRRGNVVYNKEHRKCTRLPHEHDVADKTEQNDEKFLIENTPSEEELIEMMHFAQVGKMRCQARCRPSQIKHKHYIEIQIQRTAMQILGVTRTNLRCYIASH